MVDGLVVERVVVMAVDQEVRGEEETGTLVIMGIPYQLRNITMTKYHIVCIVKEK